MRGTMVPSDFPRFGIPSLNVTLSAILVPTFSHPSSHRLLALRILLLFSFDNNAHISPPSSFSHHQHYPRQCNYRAKPAVSNPGDPEHELRLPKFPHHQRIPALINRKLDLANELHLSINQSFSYSPRQIESARPRCYNAR
jgi:hypothetical protein